MAQQARAGIKQGWPPERSPDLEIGLAESWKRLVDSRIIS
jgi:hypothetical protein